MPKKLVKSVKKAKVRAISASSYAKFITGIKEKVLSSQLKATMSVNREMIQLYWEIGMNIVERQEKNGWGTNVIEKAAKDLQNEFPGVEGFSARNIWRMRAFFKAYELGESILPRAVAELAENGLPVVLGGISWSHNIILLEKLSSREERLWYAHMTIEERKWYKRYGKAITNFDSHLPAAQSHLAKQSLKDPTIGLIICKKKNDYIVEYALQDVRKPMGVVGYETKIVEVLPKRLAGKLPTVQEIEEELNKLVQMRLKAPRQKKKSASSKHRTTSRS